MAFWNRRPRAPEPYTFEPSTGQVIKIADIQPSSGMKDVSFDLSTGPIPWQYGSGWPGTNYAGMYRRQPAVRQVVDFLATNIGALNLKTYARVGDADRVELDDHPLAQLLRRPNAETTKYRLFRDLEADIAVEDVGYWGKLRFRGRVGGLVRIPKSAIETQDVDGRITYRNTKTQTAISRENLVIFPGYHPDGNPWGVSPMETLRRILNEAWYSDLNREYFWKNAARREGLIERPPAEISGEWEDADRVRFRESWQAAHSGAVNAGKTPVLEDGMHWVDTTFSPKESEYIEGRRLTAEEVARAYGIAPKLLGIGDDTNANIESFHRQLYQDVLGPRLTSIEQEIELQLLPDLDNTPASSGRVYVEFNLAEKLRASFEEQAKVLVTSTGVPFTTVNESRAFLNLPRLDESDLDTVIRPLNVMYGNQPAPTVPTATPASPPSEMPGQPSTRSTAALTKADVPESVQRRRAAAADEQTEVLVRYFRKQEKAYLAFSSRKAKGSKASWDGERWDRTLHEALFSAAVPLAGSTGQRAARQVSGVYNEDQTTEFLASTTLKSAQNINAQTMDELNAANDAESVLNVFAVAKGSRATQLGMSQATGIINFARKEAAVQSQVADGQQRMKTWVVTSKNSRHPQLDGETVPVDDTFSNGMLWPGDSAGAVNQIANCHCLLNLG